MPHRSSNYTTMLQREADMKKQPEPEITERQQRIDRQADDVLQFYSKLVENKVPIIQASAITQTWIGTWKLKQGE